MLLWCLRTCLSPLVSRLHLSGDHFCRYRCFIPTCHTAPAMVVVLSTLWNELEMAPHKGEKRTSERKGALRNDDEPSEGPGNESRRVCEWQPFDTALVSLSWPNPCIYSCHLSPVTKPPFFLLSRYIILLALSPFSPGFLSVSPILSLERAAKEPAAMVRMCPASLPCALETSQRMWTQWGREACLPSQHTFPGLAHCWGLADTWMDFWMQECRKFAARLIWSLHFTGGENLMSRGGREKIPSSAPTQRQRRTRVQFSWPLFYLVIFFWDLSPAHLNLVIEILDHWLL